MALTKAEERMFGGRDVNEIDTPEGSDFPEITDLPEEDSYLTYIGNGKGTFVSRFINGGDVVRSGDTVFMNVAMLAMQLRSHWRDPRTNEWRPHWRLATADDIAEVKRNEDTSNRGTAGKSELARIAREQSINSGEASYETEQAHVEENAVKSTRAPKRRKKSKDIKD